jgi:predicted GTPase
MSNSPRNMLRKQVVKMKVCVVGDPLAGKSTLINLLLQE